MSRTKREWEDTSRMIQALQGAGISYEDAWQLRRISMTLQRWFEGECGNSDTYASWCITRGSKHKDVNGKAVFTHDDDGKSYLEHHPYSGMVSYTPIPDREKGARKRLAKIMAKYPSLQTYIQNDPRGCALYVLRQEDVPEGEDASCYYTRGIAIHQ